MHFEVFNQANHLANLHDLTWHLTRWKTNPIALHLNYQESSKPKSLAHYLF
jgi:hypothetical protein